MGKGRKYIVGKSALPQFVFHYGGLGVMGLHVERA